MACEEYSKVVSEQKESLNNEEKEIDDGLKNLKENNWKIKYLLFFLLDFNLI